MTKGTAPKRDAVAVDGNWLPLPIAFLASRACAELSLLAWKMLLVLLGQLGTNGYGNGRLDLHRSRLKAAGWSSAASASAAIHELIEANLLVVTRRGHKGCIGLYAVTLFPMHCDRKNLEVGPSGWTIKSWRDESGADQVPTATRPAKWHRPRKRDGDSRSGSASGKCAPAAEVNECEISSCTPAGGAHRPLSLANAIPQRDPLSRVPSVAAVDTRHGATLPAASRCFGRVIAGRVRHGRQPSYHAAPQRRLAAVGHCSSPAGAEALNVQSE